MKMKFFWIPARDSSKEPGRLAPVFGGEVAVGVRASARWFALRDAVPVPSGLKAELQRIEWLQALACVACQRKEALA